MIGLTPLQRACLEAIEAHHARQGVMPTLDELRAALGVASRNAARALLCQLEQRGAIARTPGRARAIFILRSTCPHCGGNVRVQRAPGTS